MQRARARTTARADSSWQSSSSGGLLLLGGSPTLIRDEFAPAVAIVTHVRMQDLRENLGTLHETGTRPIEEGVPVGEEDAVLTHRAQVLPDRIAAEHAYLTHRGGDVVATGRDEDHV